MFLFDEKKSPHRLNGSIQNFFRNIPFLLSLQALLFSFLHHALVLLPASIPFFLNYHSLLIPFFLSIFPFLPLPSYLSLPLCSSVILSFFFSFFVPSFLINCHKSELTEIQCTIFHPVTSVYKIRHNKIKERMLLDHTTAMRQSNVDTSQFISFHDVLQYKLLCPPPSL